MTSTKLKRNPILAPRKTQSEMASENEAKCKIICVGLKKELVNEREIYTTINHFMIYTHGDDISKCGLRPVKVFDN